MKTKTPQPKPTPGPWHIVTAANPERKKDVRLGDYNAFLRLEGVDRPVHIGVWKRLGTVVAIWAQ